MTTEHVVRTGECMASIADAYGFFWETLWNHPANAGLKELRQDPNVLLPGDVVVIPDKRIHSESCTTGQRHVFRRRGVPALFDLRLLRNGEPRAGLAYTLIVDGRLTLRGTTGEDGRLRHFIPPQSKEAVLRIGDSEEHVLALGHLDPATVESGVRARLTNLRYLRRIDSPAHELKEAIAAFQTKCSLEPTGEMDDATRGKLVAESGG